MQSFKNIFCVLTSDISSPTKSLGEGHHIKKKKTCSVDRLDCRDFCQFSACSVLRTESELSTFLSSYYVLISSSSFPNQTPKWKNITEEMIHCDMRPAFACDCYGIVSVCNSKSVMEGLLFLYFFFLLLQISSIREKHKTI